MKLFSLILFFIIPVLPSTKLFAQNMHMTALFNGKDLRGWNSYIGPPLDVAGKN